MAPSGIPLGAPPPVMGPAPLMPSHMYGGPPPFMNPQSGAPPLSFEPSYGGQMPMAPPPQTMVGVDLNGNGLIDAVVPANSLPPPHPPVPLQVVNTCHLCGKPANNKCDLDLNQ